MIRLYALGLFGDQNIIAGIFRTFISIVVPVAAAVLCFRCQWQMEGSLPSIVISAFSIFSAMLFSSQVAAFSVFNYKMLEICPKHSDDEIVQEVNAEVFSRREGDLRGAFRKINAGISILTLLAVSITSMTLAIVASPSALIENILTAGVALLSVHFLVSFILIGLHVFSLFDSAYLGEGE